jgi:hypothetical protein
MAEDTHQGEQTNQTPKLRRRPSRRMSDEDRKVLLEICQRPDCRDSNGKIHVATVARLTGLGTGAIYGFLERDSYLRTQLGEVEPDKLMPTDVDQIDRPQQPTLPLAMVNFDARQVAQGTAIRRQEMKMLKEDWVALGMTEEQGKKWTEYCNLGAAPTMAVIHGTGGQLISNLQLLDEIIKGDAEKILQKKLPVELDKKGEARDSDEVERDWRYMVFAGMQLQLQCHQALHKTLAMLAKTAADMQRINAGSKPEDKGHFETRGAKIVTKS